MSPVFRKQSLCPFCHSAPFPNYAAFNTFAHPFHPFSSNLQHVVTVPDALMGTNGDSPLPQTSSTNFFHLHMRPFILSLWAALPNVGPIGTHIMHLCTPNWPLQSFDHFNTYNWPNTTSWGNIYTASACPFCHQCPCILVPISYAQMLHQRWHGLINDMKGLPKTLCKTMMSTQTRWMISLNPKLCM